MAKIEGPNGAPAGRAKAEQGQDTPPLTGLPVIFRILATTDLHMHLLPWDYYADTASRMRGLSLVGGLIAQARGEVPHSILVDNGDFLQGSPLGDFLAESLGVFAEAAHPMILAMNHLGYDAACLGNHEFSHGLDFLSRAVAQAKFPVLSANVVSKMGTDPSEDQHFVLPTAIVRRDIALPDGSVRPLQIGLVGLTPAQVMQWEQETLAGKVEVRGMFESADHHLKMLRRQGADLVIALAHSGLGDPSGPADQENTVFRLAKHLRFDAIIAGHTHNAFPSADFAPSAGMDPLRGVIHDTPTVLPGFYGSHLGVIDLELAPRGSAGWAVVSHKARLRPVFRRQSAGGIVAAVKEDPMIRVIAQKSHSQTRRWARRAIGETAVPLHSFFSLVGPSPSVRLVAQAQADHVAHALRGSLWDGLPILAAAAPFRTGGRSGPENYTHIPAGPLTLRHIADLYSFPNTITALLLTGAEVHDWLERAAAQFRTVRPGAQDADFIDPEMPGFDFDLMHGLDYEIDLSRPARYDAMGQPIAAQHGRVVHLRHKGAELDPKARFILATNSYRLGGGGGYHVARHNKVILRGGQSVRAIVSSYVSQLGRIDPVDPPNWRFCPMAGTSVSFVSSPRAVDLVSQAQGPQIEPLERMESGFQRFRMVLG